MTESIATLVEKLNNLKILQTKSDWAEVLPDDIWENTFKGKFKEVAHNIDVDTHRWYETSITVLQLNESFMGVRFITNMFSESQDYEDCYHHLEFYEMEEYTTIAYRAKKN
jgi:hypothetical protein